jgi:predicted dehydrogenase
MSFLQSCGRRSFLKQAAAGGAAAPFFIRNLLSAPPSGKLRLASFGAGGMAFHTLDGIAGHPSVTVTCVAEVDSSRLDQLKKKYPDTRVYDDWRRMLARERKNIDIACVGTPDHMHAPMAMTAMRMGLPVYIQKPLAHDLHEVRKLTEMARRKKLVTQMGIQIHSAREYQVAVKLIQGGAIGKVSEVHSWSEKKWGDPVPLPERSDTPPSTLSWDQWLGVAAPRPYLDGYYHPSNWRKRIDFGTATFGDMGCHIVDPVFGSLKLGAPLSVRSEGPAPDRHNWALDSVIHYEFPGGVKVTWYDGDQRPPAEILKLAGSRTIPGQGSLFVGSAGAMLLPHIGMPVLLPEELARDHPMPEAEAVNHYKQFADAVLGKAKVTTPLDYSGPLTEAVLLGPVATRFPRTTLEWDSARLKFTNSREATALVRGRYRRGWKVRGL